MINLNDDEINDEIIRTIDEYLREYGDNIEYLDIYRICHKLISNLYDAEKDKSDVCSDPNHVKCPHCGHIGIEWDREHDWYCPDCGNYVEYKD